MARRHTALVNRKTLGVIAEQIGLAGLLRASKGEKDGDPRGRETMLADACEALIAAIYLDGGLEPARAFIKRHWVRFIDTQTEDPKDAKSALQEWAQGRGLPLPVYEEVEQSGPAHAPRYVIQVSVEGVGAMRAEGRSKRDAQYSAAEALLAIIKKEKKND